MVFAFVIQTLLSSPCRILFSSTYNYEQTEDSPILENVRVKRKEKILLVANRIQSEFMFRRATKPLNIQQDNMAQTSNVGTSMEGGIFRLMKDDLFNEEYHVAWKSVGNIGISFVLYPEENKALAEGTLRLVLKYVFQLFKPLERPEEILQHPDHLTSLLHMFLPSGQLLFMNDRVIKQFEKDLNRILKDKK